MIFFSKIMCYLKLKLAGLQRVFYQIKRSKYSKMLTFTEASRLFSQRNHLYAYMNHYFKLFLPTEIQEHRRYFSQNMRGFGEDAFHAMWWTLFTEFKPKKVLEIGVYRGQVVSLWGLISKLNDFYCEVHGVSPFSPAGDDVSSYLKNLDYLQDVINSHRYFCITLPHFLKAYSTDQIAIDYIKSTKWDLIYIDGNHNYDVSLSDYRLCCDALAENGILVMDDSSLYTDFKPPFFSFAGHPGPSRVVQCFAMNELNYLGGVGHNNVFQRRKL